VTTRRRFGSTPIRLTGTSFKQPELAALGRGIHTGVLVREPENPHDPDAVGVYVRGKRIGYVPKGWRQTKMVFSINKWMSPEHEGVVLVSVVGGKDDGSGGRQNFGARIGK